MNANCQKTSSEVAIDYRACVYPVPRVSLTIDDSHPVEGGIKQLLKHIRSEWPTERVQFKTFTDGYTNKLIGCSVNPDDVVLVRIYGNRTDLFIDREREIKAMVILHNNGCAAPIFCRFENGIAYGFVSGVMINVDLARKPTIQKLIARQLAHLQAIDIAAAAAEFGDDVHINTEPSLFMNLYGWAKQGALNSKDYPQYQARVADLPVCYEQLVKEIDQLHDVLPNLGSPVVFSHNDFLLQNIIYDEKAQKVTFIDFEYTAYNYQAHDVAMHFCDYAGFQKLDFTLYPDRDYQLSWLRTFLEFSYEESGRSASSVTDVDVERLFVQVQKFALGVCLYNAIWALMQILHSDIDFNFIRYVHLWLEQYYAWKEKFLSLKMP